MDRETQEAVEQTNLILLKAEMLIAQLVPFAGYSLVHLAIAASTGVCIGVLALFAGKSILHPHSNSAKDSEDSTRADFGMESREKRLAHRRQGRTVDISITDLDRHAEPINGWIIDRSTGGVKFCAPQGWDVGKLLCVRVAHIGEAMPWIEVRVKHCRHTAKGWEVGCQFLHPLTWNILLAFG
ncbi:MAG: PilZ domain-containing protein [Gemmataceae bacterium]